MAFFVSTERLIEKWERDGLIDDIIAQRLRQDVEKRSSKFSLGTVLATLGGLLLGAAVIMIVAANWQDMPRIMRIGLVFALIWIGYLGGAWRQSRGDRVLPAALYTVAAASFGAGIALVGQMYHLSGDAHTAALVWSLGVLASALLLRSGLLAAFGAGVALFYLSSFIAFDADIRDNASFQYMGLILAVASYFAAWFTRSRIAAHVTTIFVLTWLFFFYLAHTDQLILWGLVALGSIILLFDGLAHSTLEKWTRFSHPLAAYGLITSLIGLVILKFEYYNIFVGEAVDHNILYSVLILIFVVGALTLCGRNNGGLRAIAYTAFSLEVLYLAFETVGTMIGTSGFFLTAGILVLLLAVFVRRVEKRFERKQMVEAGK